MTKRVETTMAAPQPRDLSPLLPDRHRQLDFFVCDIFDAAPKSDTASMAFPLFTLSTKPDHTIRRYEYAGNWIEVAPSPRGRATVYDRDVLIYCISQCMAALNKGRKIEKTLRLNAHHLLQVTNRPTGGSGYTGLQAALERLRGTQITTNITTGGHEQWDVFGFIERAKTIKETRDGRMIELEITLSDWVFNAIAEKGGEILTISRDYFRLRKPLERRLYELARKHCGHNSSWKFKTKTLYERTGSASSYKEFLRMLRNIIKDNTQHRHIPDYDFALEDDLVIFTPHPEFTDVYSTKDPQTSIMDAFLRLRPATYENARKYARRYDIYAIEDDWRIYMHKIGTPPKSPDAAFIAFVKKWVEKRS